MASILDGLKEAIVEVLRPGTRQALGERAALRQMYETNNGNILPNQWYRLHNAAGSCVGFSYSCNCKMEYQLLSAFEWARDYHCSSCRAKFDLYKFVGITDAEGKFKVQPKDIEPLLSTLPPRPRLAGARERSRVIDTWDSSSSGDVEYEMYDPGN